MADSPLLNSDGVVSIEIRCNGSQIPDTYDIYSVRTRSELNRVSEAIIVLGDGDPATQQFSVADSDHFLPGAEVEIKSGYANRTDTLFKGVVTGVRLRINNNRGSRLEVTCRHKAVVLLQGRRRAVIKAGKKDSDLIKDVTGEAGISANVEATEITLPEFVRYDVTDWSFIVNRADINGLVVSCTENEITVAAPAFKESAGIEVTYGEDLIAMDMEISVGGQFSEYESSSWDPSTQELASNNTPSSSDNGFGNLKSSQLAQALDPDVLSMSSSAFHDSAALSAFTNARAVRADLSKVQGWVSFQGNASLKPNTVLALSALGKRFSGNGLIGGVVHRIEAGIWKTEVQLGLSSLWISDSNEFVAPKASAVTSATHGLVIGKVTQLAEDPDGLSRIQVAIPELDKGVTPLWARLGAVYASGDVGCMFLPEIDDEVIVGFLNDNPSSPVVLGSLHNPKNKPPEGLVEYSNENNIKTIVTREKIKITFDEEKKSLTLETPANNKVEIDDDAGLLKLSDQNGNTLLLDDSGIKLDSASDITLTASGNIHISASGNLKMSGSDVEASGSTGFKASGGASAELSAGGTTKVAGAMVQIN